MNIFHRLTIQSLKKNKTRTLVTIIGIMLSTALICAVTTSFASVRKFAIDFMEFSYGKFDASEINTDLGTYKLIKYSDKVKSTGVLSYIGYADIKISNTYKPYLYISGVQEDENGIIPIHITSGRMPQNRNEIIIPEHLAENGNVVLHAGDKLTLEIGDRKIDPEKIIGTGIAAKEEITDQEIDYNDINLIQYNSFTVVNDEEGNSISAEYLDIREKRDYTVVGIYARPYFEEASSPGYTALTVPDDYSENIQYDVYYTLKNTKDIYKFRKENNLSGNINTFLLLCKGVSRYNRYYAVIFGLFSVVVGLIMFGSIMLIYNAFAISISERTKQFGLLSSIGGTKKQIRRMVRFEAAVLSVIGIPLGIILGIAGMWITFLAIGSKFLLFLSNDDFKEPLRICISPAAIIAAAVIAFITIRISAWLPSKRATKISAVEAIRQNNDIKETKYIKTPKVIYKFFGLPGIMAHKNFKRSKKKYHATIISLFMSVVLFISASAFTYYITGGANDAFSTYGYDYRLIWDNGDYGINDIDEILSIIKNTEYITDAAYCLYDYNVVYIPENDIEANILKDHPSLFDNFNITLPQRDGYKMIVLPIIYVDDAAYLEYIRQEGLSEAEFYNREAPLGIAVDEGLEFDFDAERYIRLKLFSSDNSRMKSVAYNKIDGYPFIQQRQDTVIYYKPGGRSDDAIEVPYEESIHDIELNIGKVVTGNPYFTESEYISVIYPFSFMDDLTGNFSERFGVEYVIKSSDCNRGYDALLSAFEKNSVKHESFYNYAKFSEEDRNSIIIVKVFAYGFIVLISLIAVANVFNTITTNINLRRREFAMLKSVGMTDKSLRKMLDFECIMYGTKALIYGIPVSAVITYLIYDTVNRGIETAFVMPWKAAGTAVLSVFIVVFLTMMYSMRKIKKENPIDALKNENL